MKKGITGLTVLFLLCCILQSNAQNITAAEYFLDTDPGAGKATAIVVTPGADIAINFSLKVNTLTTGFHQLYTRTRDANGGWSIAEQRSFYIDPVIGTTVSKLSGAEYFLDADPGTGKGKAIAVTTGDSANLLATITANGLADGFHQLYIRTKNAAGVWGIAEQRSFYIDKVIGNIQPKLSAAEYFIDTDPGIGQGKPVTVTAADSVNIVINFSAAALAQGFHQLYVRTKDANGRWGIAEQRSFFINEATQLTTPNLVSTEYFIDTDPGVGKGTVIAGITPADSISITKSLAFSKLSAGFHQLYIRSKDALGHWGVAGQRGFYVDGDLKPTPAPLVAAEYFINADPGEGLGIAIPLTKTDSLNLSKNFPAAGLAFGNYTYSIRFKDSTGKWGIAESRPFTVCQSYGPKSNFYYAVAGTDVSFVNTSTDAATNHWIFGDGDTSDLVHPFHHYLPGLYKVSLVTKNACVPGGDTLTQTISVIGLSDINTNKGGNTGAVTVKITGAGFAAGMKLFLHKNGEQDIAGDTLIVQNPGLMSTTFDLIGKATGFWDVIAVFPDNKTDTIHSGFTILDGNAPKLYANITGDGVLRIGFNQVYTVTYGNTGNTDAILVPLAIGGLPFDTDIEILDTLFKLDALPGEDTLNIAALNIRHTINDTAARTAFRIFTIDRIPANSSGTLSFVFHVPVSTVLHTYPVIKVVLGRPLLTSADLAHRKAYRTGYKISDLDGSDAQDCAINVMSAATEDLIDRTTKDIVGAEIDQTGFYSCYTGIAKIKLGKIWDLFLSHKEGSTAAKVLDKADELASLAAATTGCLRAGLTVAGVASIAFGQVEFVPAIIEANEFLIGQQLAITKAGEIIKIAKLAKDCLPVFQYDYDQLFSPIIGNAWDPNVKYGSGDSSVYHYTNNRPLTYTVGFENDKAANLNAQTVTVSDTLNGQYLDYSTLGFTSVSIGKTFYHLPAPARSFFHDFDFTAEYGVKARATASFDTSTGTIQWKFTTIDPATNQQTKSALSGFLPPDVVSPEGQAYVSFIISPKKSIQSGNSLCNQATIKFDVNPDITTNCWQNVFDIGLPKSKVAALPDTTYQDHFVVKWSGSDNLSGIQRYDIYSSVNDSAFTPWLYATTKLSDTFPGTIGNKYAFYSIATDKANNEEAAKTALEGVTYVGRLKSDSICIGSDTYFISGKQAAGNTYQWQVNTGGGFVNLAASVIYSGVNTDTLKLITPPTSLVAYRYRCMVANGGVRDSSQVQQLHFKNEWIGALNTQWTSAANWSCGSVPDQFTDVIIRTGMPRYPVIISNVECRSLKVQKAASVIVNTGFSIKISNAGN